MIRPVSAFDRLGTETAFSVLAHAQSLAAQGHRVINLGIGQPDFRTPAHVVEAGKRALDDGAHGYTPTAGIPQLRNAVAADLGRRHHVDVNPGSVLIVPGAKPVMYTAIEMFGEPGAEIMYPNPGFPIYESMINYTGAKAVPIELHESSGFSFSAEEVLRQVTDRTRLIILNTPSNPTGGVIPGPEIERLLAGLAAFPDCAILSDEVYSRILYGEHQHVSLLTYPEIRDRLIVIDGWSKTYAMTGWRIGYGIWPEALFPHAERLAVNSWSCVNAATQWAAVAALEGPQDDVFTMVRAFDERREVIVRELNAIPGIRCADPGGAFYVFPNIEGTGMTSAQFAHRFLEEAYVATIAGTSFGAMGEGYIRISYAASMEEITEAMQRLRAFVGA